MEQRDCRYFNGYKPCGFGDGCREGCSSYQKVHSRVLIVHLEALGAVLRATSILRAVKRKFPESHITWVTQAPAQHLLANNPLIDQVYTLDTLALLELETLSFDVGYCVDKSRRAYGVAKRLDVAKLYGFKVEAETGAIVPATDAADELWQLGLSDSKKFYQNKKAETQLMIEALELGPFERDEYVVELTEEERALSGRRRNVWLGNKKAVVGINTGCSVTIAAKKMTVEGHRQMIKRLQSKFPLVSFVLLGGPEDSERNQKIADGLGLYSSPTKGGLRDGLASVDACDIVVSGDSLGMHMAIALQKWVVAWFGPTCSHEIDLYKRGGYVLADVSCAPCWKRSCDAAVMCYDRVNYVEVEQLVEEGIQWLTLSSKQHFSETSFSASLF